jgi:hypothetical protein
MQEHDGVSCISGSGRLVRTAGPGSGAVTAWYNARLPDPQALRLRGVLGETSCLFSMSSPRVCSPS